jgi:hypothetical protein
MKVRAQGRVVELLEEREGAALLGIDVDGVMRRAWNFDRLSGPVAVGDRVVLNTVAVELELGTGGVDFVVANLRHRVVEEDEDGRIIKLRYTPVQMAVNPVEAQENPHHRELKGVESLGGSVVITGGLHSQLAPVCATAKAIDPKVRIAYVMTDGAALPIAISSLVKELKAKGLLDVTITTGNTFGGDYEAINVYSGLVAAKYVARADLIVALMGPGIVGTATRLGHTGVEHGQLVNAVGALEGHPVAIPRIFFADVRRRHHGLSHHTVTALGTVALARATVVVASIRDTRAELVASQLHEAGIFAKHDVVVIDNDVTLRALDDAGIAVTTMGRTAEQEPEYFLTAGAAAIYALKSRSKETSK